MISFNIDLKEASEDQIKEIGKAILSDLVVVIRNQKLSEQDELDVCSKIGEYQKYTSDRTKHIHLSDGILRVTGQKNKHGEEGLFGHTSALDWHANQASNENRMPLIWLYAKEFSKGSMTSWIDNVASYESLPTSLKEKIRDVKLTLGYKKGGYTTSSFFKEHHSIDKPFDLVYTNAAGKTGLYFPFNQIFGGIEKDVYEELKEHVLQDRFRYDHYWEDGDIVISEQWLTIHKRWEFKDMEKRILHRIAFDYSKIGIQ